MSARGRRAAAALLAILLVAVLAGAKARPRRDRREPGDLAFVRGAVYTVDGARSWAETVVVSKGRIVFVGADEASKPWIGMRTRIVDLEGRMLLPAFHDSHVHPISGGVESLEVDLHGIESAAEVLEKIRAYAAAHPNAAWIRGSGWELPAFPNANPTRQMLDEVVPDRPAYLEAMDGHSAWVNSRALAVAGVTRDTPDPPHGRIERDPQTGEPSGALREEASHLVSSHLPKRTTKEYEEGLRQALRLANGFGLVSLQEASASERDLETYAAFDRRGALTARIRASILCDTDRGAADVARIADLRRRFHGRRLATGGVKIFADGVLETRTAAVLEPYLGTNGDRGKVNVEPAAFRELATALDREGLQIHVHAIGDRAVRDTLDALEAARKANGPRDARHHIAHLQLIDPADIPRFRRLGVVANFQPFWANGDRYITELAEPALGPERSRWMYPIASVLDSGAVVAFGSDWSVSSLNPLDGIEVAVTHRAPGTGGGSAEPPWLPQERIALADAIAGYTIRGAYLDFMERETGSIEPGKWADLVVVDKNLFEIPASRVHEARVVATFLEGREVYRAKE